MKLPLDLKIYAALVIVGSVWSLLSVHPTIVLTPLGVFATVDRWAYTYALVMQLMFPLWAILIILKSPAGWYLAFCHRLYWLISIAVALRVYIKGIFATLAATPGSGSEASYYAQKLSLGFFVVNLALSSLHVVYLLWRRKRFFAVCRAAKSAKSSGAEGPEA
jgi:hypothetical protein